MSLGLRMFAALAVVVIVAIGVPLAHSGARTSDRAGGIGFIVLTPGLAWWIYWRPYVELSRRFLYIRNPVRSRLIALEAIRDVSPLSTGLRIQLDDDAVVAWSLQQGLMMTATSSETRVTQAARIILGAAEDVRQGKEPRLTLDAYMPPVEAAEAAQVRRALTRQIRWAAVSLALGIAFLALATLVFDPLAYRHDSDTCDAVSTATGCLGLAATFLGLAWLTVALRSRRALGH